MLRLFSLFPLLLPLPNLVLAADPVCTLENRVCAENNNSGKCIRYENTFTCVTLNPAGSRCTVDANPTLTDCTLSAPVCSAESGGICLETTTDFVCKSEPTGEGIRIDDTSVTVSYSKETKGEIPAGCIIGAEVCLDDDARDIEVENWEGHFVSANPICWVTERTILCPSVDGAASCQKLELAGCQKLTDPVCEAEEHGVCVRWSSTYRCTRDEVIGDDIITDDVVTTPGDVTEDDSACRKELEDAAARGENCTVKSKVCVKTDPTGVLPCLEYRTTMTCTSSSTDTCGSLKNLSASGDCMLAAEPECTLTDADGNCRRTESTYVCTASVTSESVSPATFLKAMTVTNWRVSDDCLLDDGSVMTASLSLLSRASTTDNSSGCILASRTCIEGEGLRFVEGRPAYRACWAWEEKWTCRAEGNECLEYEKDPSCKLVSETCSDGSPDCPRPSRVYSCTRPGLSASVGQVCDGQICVGDQCQDVGDTADGDFIDAILQLEIGRQLSVYGDTNVNEFFGGTVSTCRDRMAAETCCRADRRLRPVPPLRRCRRRRIRQVDRLALRLRPPLLVGQDLVAPQQDLRLVGHGCLLPHVLLLGCNRPVLRVRRLDLQLLVRGLRLRHGQPVLEQVPELPRNGPAHRAREDPATLPLRGHHLREEGDGARLRRNRRKARLLQLPPCPHSQRAGPHAARTRLRQPHQARRPRLHDRRIRKA